MCWSCSPEHALEAVIGVYIDLESYANNSWESREDSFWDYCGWTFMDGDKYMVKVLSQKEIMKFGLAGKLRWAWKELIHACVYLFFVVCVRYARRREWSD